MKTELLIAKTLTDSIAKINSSLFIELNDKNPIINKKECFFYKINNIKYNNFSCLVSFDCQFHYLKTKTNKDLINQFNRFIENLDFKEFPEYEISFFNLNLKGSFIVYGGSND